MSFGSKVEHLIVDTSAFIKNVPLQEAGENIITEQSVINEIKSKRQLRRLVVLPYELVIKDVFPENIKFVTEFAKKTGDYTSLSATDIKVIALTYQLEKEKVGTDHLKESPAIVKTLPASKSEPLAHPKSIIGFYVPGDDAEDSEDDEETVSNPENPQKNEEKVKDQQEETKTPGEKDSESDSEGADEESEGYLTTQSDQEHRTEETDLTSKFKSLKCNADDFELEEGAENADEVLAPVGEESSEEEEEEESQESEEDDDDGWITPSNVAKAKKDMESDIISDKPAKVACMTTDFAMQNVLMQIGLNVASLDGRVIRQMRTFIFRCYACFKTTSIMTKVFCPNCGLRTLKKVAVSLDDEGNEMIHINFRKPLSAKGKRFSLPTPKGGKHANNPILFEDQPLPDQRPSRLARMKNDPLNDDYIAGYSPFIMRDVNSKSAMLGIRAGHSNFKYWMKKNPNESRHMHKHNAFPDHHPLTLAPPKQTSQLNYHLFPQSPSNAPMLCPKVWDFKAPQHHNEIARWSKPEVPPTISNHYYNHLVSVVVPLQKKIPQDIIDSIVVDSDYYKVQGLPLYELVDKEFIEAFVKTGELTLLSTKTKIDLDNCVCITPKGQLVLSLTGEDYQKLGIEGKRSFFDKTRYAPPL